MASSSRSNSSGVRNSAVPRDDKQTVEHCDKTTKHAGWAGRWWGGVGGEGGGVWCVISVNGAGGQLTNEM